MEPGQGPIPVDVDLSGFQLITYNGRAVLLPRQNQPAAPQLHHPSTTNGAQNQMTLVPPLQNGLVALQRYLQDPESNENEYHSLKTGLSQIKDHIDRCEQMIEARHQDFQARQGSNRAILPPQYQPQPGPMPMPQTHGTYTPIQPLQAQYNAIRNPSATVQHFPGAPGTSNRGTWNQQRVGVGTHPHSMANTTTTQHEHTSRGSMSQQVPQTQRQVPTGGPATAAQTISQPGYQFQNTSNNVGVSQSRNTAGGMAPSTLPHFHQNTQAALSILSQQPGRGNTSQSQYSVQGNPPQNSGQGHPHSAYLQTGLTPVSYNQSNGNNMQASHNTPSFNGTGQRDTSRASTEEFRSHPPIAQNPPLQTTLNPLAQKGPPPSAASTSKSNLKGPRSPNKTSKVHTSQAPSLPSRSVAPANSHPSEATSLSSRILQAYGKRKAPEPADSLERSRKKVAREESPRPHAQANSDFASNFWGQGVPVADAPSRTPQPSESNLNNEATHPILAVDHNAPPPATQDSTWNSTPSLVGPPSYIPPSASPLGARIEEVASDELSTDTRPHRASPNPLQITIKTDTESITLPVLSKLVTSSTRKIESPTNEPLFLPELPSPSVGPLRNDSIGGLQPMRHFLYVDVPRPTPNPIRYGPKHVSQGRYRPQRSLTQATSRANAILAHEDSQRLTIRTCEWANCSAVLISLHALHKHIAFRHLAPLSQTALFFKCQWASCPRVLYSIDKLHDHLSLHITTSKHCIREGCTFKTPSEQALRFHIKNVHNDDMTYLKPLPSSSFVEPPESRMPLPDHTSILSAISFFVVTGDNSVPILSRTPSPIPAFQSPIRLKPGKKPHEQKKDEWSFLDPFYEDTPPDMDELDDSPLNAFLAELRSTSRGRPDSSDELLLD
ncbi:hypothetical protein FRC14_003853 [Serendipita sp. 396]|nr:hypothetical protein FRC14_003853 [Serendipita sp. 396]KAG8789459.1 hypothetical protein FRC15_008316 [Serendipita sp. 397]KAG8879045.1 hypothetical protein FRC20_003804 [Serendipita sp. 405]